MGQFGVARPGEKPLGTSYSAMQLLGSMVDAVNVEHAETTRRQYARSGHQRRARSTSARPEPFTIVLDCCSGSLSGSDIRCLNSRLLVVNCVRNGAIQRWNEENACQIVERGDRISDVNGVNNDASKMLSECMSGKMLKMTVLPRFRVAV